MWKRDGASSNGLRRYRWKENLESDAVKSKVDKESSNNLEEDLEKQTTELDSVTGKCPQRSTRPRLTLDGPYTNLLTVDTPPLCQKGSCQYCVNLSTSNDKELTWLNPGVSSVPSEATEQSKDRSTEEKLGSGSEQGKLASIDRELYGKTSPTASDKAEFQLFEAAERIKMRVAVIRPGGAEDREDEEEASLGDPDMVIKHPLQNSWAMWFFKNDKSRDWKDNLRVITTFDTVEDFWGLYNHTLPASKLQSGCDYSVFKAGIQPMWEDTQNKKGGRWLINLNKSQRQPHLDDLWLETLLCLIGEGFDEYSDDICGATVNIRTKGDKLGLWTRDATRNEATKKIGMKLKESLNVPPKIIIGFQAHSDTAGKAGSTVKNRFTV